MSEFTEHRTVNDTDEIWLLQHSPVFTQGRAGKPEHLLSAGDIPVVQSDRGGQITYHGPGQLIVYPLIDLKRRKLGVRGMVSLLEDIAVMLLASYEIEAYLKADAPGVYVRCNNHECKIASLGLRVRKGCCFHGLSLNVDMDLSPFSQINPCGYEGLAMTQIKDLLPGRDIDYPDIEQSIAKMLANKLGVTEIRKENTLDSLRE